MSDRKSKGKSTKQVWKCEICPDVFDTLKALEFHKLAQHKTTIVECSQGMATHITFADAVELAMNQRNTRDNGSDASNHLNSCGDQKTWTPIHSFAPSRSCAPAMNQKEKPLNYKEKPLKPLDQKETLLSKIKNFLKSANQKLDEESPPIENIRFQCYTPRNTYNNLAFSGYGSSGSSVSGSYDSTSYDGNISGSNGSYSGQTSPVIAKTYLELRNTTMSINPGVL